ncbi:nucleotidyltransferase domain-containing protein, partial [Candidatus Azambacteria bacterium]|nr:nucleotidyltransferase domain-containing protein [Candidatus Azambacteria bacterium]
MEQLNLKTIKENITPIFDAYGIKHAFIFGSYSRGEQKKGSDIDLL